VNILGISEIDNDAGAALFVDDELVGAANEERFSRIKNHTGFPIQTVDWLLRRGDVKARDLDLVAVVKAEPDTEIEQIEAPLRDYDWWGSGGPVLRRAVNWAVFRGLRRVRGRREIRHLGRQISGWLDGNQIAAKRVVRAHHHRSHAAAAFFSAGFDDALAVTCDGQGGGVTASAWRCSGASLELVREIRTPDSMGFFYAMVTRALGFRPARHEGKVTGLAAYEPADADALALFREIAFATADGFRTPGVYGALPEVRRLARARGQAPIAAAAQLVLEEIITGWIRGLVAETGLERVVLGGGVFANVKLNQRVLELYGVADLFVFPHMADGGLGYGAVVDLLAGLQGRKSQAIGDVYWGPEFEDSDVEAALLRAGLDYRHAPDIEPRVARLLAQDKTVGRFAGRMELGPRALGNRSVLHAATDPSVNQWLNAKLERNEFMPFAPVVREPDAARLLSGYRGGERASRFMTVTFGCTPPIREKTPAVVHVDGTARPQVLREVTNPGYYAILDAYVRETGLDAIINTSFNMHEEPIVMTPDDAIRGFIASRIDALAIGPFLCQREG